MTSTNLSSVNIKFGLSLYHEFPGHDKNLFYSPASISIALAMTYLGARGHTATEMSTALHFNDLKPEELHSSFHALLSALKNPDDGSYKLMLANRLFAETTYNFHETFLNESKIFYNAELAKVDFQHNAEGARKEINKWVEDQTVQKIKDLFPSGSLDSFTRLVLANAIYFKGDWASKFKAADTKEESFNVDVDRKVPVQMMTQKRKFNYGHSQDLQCYSLELPYVNNKLSMFILLPAEISLKEVESKVTAEHFTDVEKQFHMRSCEVVVKMPKFKLEQSFDVGDTLSKLGIRDLFASGAADLSGMDGTKQLFVSKVVHKAYVEVNEEGSEAAAATGVAVNSRCMPMIMEFIADHPFIFFIRDKETKAVLFLGRFSDPKV